MYLEEIEGWDISSGLLPDSHAPSVVVRSMTSCGTTT